MKVLITREIPRAGIELLKRHLSLKIDMRAGPPLKPKELEKAVADASAVISVIPDQITKEMLKKVGPSLKLIANYAVGYDNVDIKAATALGIYVSNTPGDLTEAVAEHALALLMSVGRKVVAADRFTREGKYKYWDPMLFLGQKFAGKTIGILGFGRIGQHLAKIVKGGFGMKILYNDLQRNDRMETELGATFVSLDDLLEKSDFISIHLPLLPSTKHLIGEREFRKMKPTAYLINTARGAIVDEDSLVYALKEGWIEGAGIDVFEDEPSIFLGMTDLDNIVVTPHIASATREARIEMARMAAENVIEVLINGNPPINLVNTELKK